MKKHLNWLKRILDPDGPDIPAEENAGVLLRMAEAGDKLTAPHDLDFHHLFARAEDAVAFLESVRAQGYSKADHDFCQEENAWLTAVHVRMVPVLDEISAIELSLDAIAARFDGRADGWGCMEIVERASPAE